MSNINQILPLWTLLERSEYNCNVVHTPGEWWNANRGQKNPAFGWWSVAFASICEVLYVPCVVAIYIEAKKHSCYRIMLWLAIVDMLALISMSLLFGITLIRGEVFCSNPTVSVIDGSFALGTWCGASAGCLLLVTNRLCELLGYKFFTVASDIVQRTNVFIFIVFCYTLFFTLLTPPVFTDSLRLGMYFDPFISNNSTTIYVNYFHTTNNLLIVIVTALLYILLCVVLVRKQDSAAHRTRLRNSKHIFIQASLICVFNVVAAVDYVYMNFFPATQFLIELGHVAWQLCHGAPPFIYLIMNKTVRKQCRALLRIPPKKNHTWTG